MLKPEQEISAKYLRTLRQTLSEVIAPEVISPAGRRALTLCDFVLVRMIAAIDEVPRVQAAHADAFAALRGHATGAGLPAPLADIFKEHSAEQSRLLAQISKAEEALRQDYEAAVQQTGAVKLPMPAALRVTGAAVEAYFAQKFSRPIRVKNCHQIPGGQSKLTVLLELEPDATLPTGMVLRIDGPESAINTTVLDEFPILDTVYKAGIAAPEPLWVEPDPRFLGAPFLVMRRMQGQAAGDLWGAQSVSPAIGLALAQALASVHGARVATIWPLAPRDARAAVAAMLEDFEASWRAGNSTPSLTMDCAYGWLKRELPRISGPTVMVHGDAHFANLLADGEELVCLLDWEFTHPGHPAEDLAYCRPYAEKIMPWEDFLRHYQAHGGHPVNAAQLEYFAVWGYLRNLTFSANMLRDYHAGKVHGIQHLAIALNTRARIEALLAHELATALQRAPNSAALDEQTAANHLAPLTTA